MIGDFFAVIAHEPVFVVGVVIITTVYAEDVLENVCEGVFEFGLKVFCNRLAKGFAGVGNDVAHHDEHHWVSGGACVAGRGIDDRAVAEVNFQGLTRAHVEANIFHVGLAFVIALVGEFVVDADVKLTFIKSKLFHGQASEVNVVIG